MPENKEKKSTTVLPDWITPVEGRSGHFVTDVDKLYSIILKEMQSHEDVGYDGKLDQYWLEITYVLAKMEFRLVLRMAKVDISGTIENTFKGENKDTWRLDRYPEGRIADLKKEYGGDNFQYRMQVGREARDIYRKIRGL